MKIKQLDFIREYGSIVATTNVGNYYLGGGGLNYYANFSNQRRGCGGGIGVANGVTKDKAIELCQKHYKSLIFQNVEL